MTRERGERREEEERGWGEWLQSPRAGFGREAYFYSSVPFRIPFFFFVILCFFTICFGRVFGRCTPRDRECTQVCGGE